jgi:hypothetical protein
MDRVDPQAEPYIADDLKKERESVDEPSYGDEDAVRRFPYNPPNMPRS